MLNRYLQHVVLKIHNKSGGNLLATTKILIVFDQNQNWMKIKVEFEQQIVLLLM